MTGALSALRRVCESLRFRPDIERRDRAAIAAARGRLEAGCCYLCGSYVEEGLARLGSTLCHDCRDGAHQTAHAI
jgi:hypothetical protein